ncbi:hypothetical protein ABXS75_00290 [Roseburia hominis]
MHKKQNIIPLKDLNLTSRFLFDEVMDDPQAHQDALSIIFGRNIPLLSKVETEKELRVSPLSRSIRMDVFSMDEGNSVYNTELSEEIGVKYMQAWEEKYYEREEGREEGRKIERQDMIKKKLQKNKSPETIADELELTLETILKLIKEMEAEPR